MTFRLLQDKIKARIDMIKKEKEEEKQLLLEGQRDSIIKGETIEKFLESEAYTIVKEVILDLSVEYETLAEEKEDIKYLKMKTAFRDLKTRLHSIVDTAKNLDDLEKNKNVKTNWLR